MHPQLIGNQLSKHSCWKMSIVLLPYLDAGIYNFQLLSLHSISSVKGVRYHRAETVTKTILWIHFQYFVFLSVCVCRHFVSVCVLALSVVCLYVWMSVVVVVVFFSRIFSLQIMWKVQFYRDTDETNDTSKVHW